MTNTTTSVPVAYRGIFNPDEPRAYKVSRSGVDYFLECPRCFYMEKRLGVKRPSGPPFNINSAVDKLLKAEFDTYRAKGMKHPIQEEYGVDATPASNDQLDKWRENFHGIQYYHKPTNLLLFGAIDDLWVNSKGEYIVVDYKATAKTDPVVALGTEKWHDAYRRQIEFYQYLLRHNGYKVSNTGYWVYCTGDPNRPSFDKRVEFRVNLISYEGNDSWVEPAVKKTAACLRQDTIPESSENCEYCKFVQDRLAAKSPEPVA
jgi:hypothetical protein